MAAVNKENSQVSVQFTIPQSDLDEMDNATVCFEERDIPIATGIFQDIFEPYEVHIYLLGTTKMLCDGSAKPPHSETLLFSDGVYTFTEDYDFADGILGDWASKTYMHVATQWSEMAVNAITLLADEGIWQPYATYPGCILYHFIVPAGNATVDYSAFLRMGATLRAAPEVEQIWEAGTELAIGADTSGIGWEFLEYSGTIPSSLLKTSVPGETSFWLYIVNYNGNSGSYSDAAGIDQLTLTAVETSRIPGDANGDGKVDVGDLGILAANYGTASGATWAMADFNDDDAVDVGDLGILAANYGTGVSGVIDFDADYAKAFDATAEDDSADQTSNSVCTTLGLPLMAGLFLAGLMLIKMEE